MTFKAGRKKTGGRKKGVTNKASTELKGSIYEAFDKVGRVEYLVSVAENDPKTFCTLLGKLLPAEINTTSDQKAQTTYVVNTGATNRPPIGVNNASVKLIRPE